MKDKSTQADSKKVIKHVIPQIGLKEILLYDPADKLYQTLKDEGEIERLDQLMHLGALSHALPGVRQARWDYTVAILYYVSKFNQVPRMTSKFNIKNINFSSTVAALQVLALTWNIGHLPGTFAIEKGIYRYLYKYHQHNPIIGLNWPGNNCSDLQDKAKKFLEKRDYLAISRILAVIKLLKISLKPNEFIASLLESFVAPFLMEFTKSESRQWPKIRQAFKVARHLAYLTLDSPFTGLQWGPSIPQLLEHQISSGDVSLENIDASISEILSPIERATYELVYHSDDARKEGSIVANQALLYLDRHANASAEIDRWLTCRTYDSLGLGQRLGIETIEQVVSIKLRSNYKFLTGSSVELEKSLRSKGFSHPIISEYKAWNSEVVLEPDELLIDVIHDSKPNSKDIGKFIIWFMTHFENFKERTLSESSLIRKVSLESSYIKILKRLVELLNLEVTAIFDPWPLQKFKVFERLASFEAEGKIWASSSKLDDPIIKNIVRDRTCMIPNELKDAYAELKGIHALRKYLRKRYAGKDFRQKWLVLTCSVKLRRDNNDLIEFDGGLVRISSRSGNITWYGLETKRGNENPLSSLNRRLDRLKIEGKRLRLNSQHAFLELPL